MLKLELIFLTFLPVLQQCYAKNFDHTEICTKSGRPCVFPFTYQHETHHRCVIDEIEGNWCGIIANFSAESVPAENMDYCVGPCVKEASCAKNGEPCIIPFTYKQQEYNFCAPPDEDHKAAWCYVSKNKSELCGDQCPDKKSTEKQFKPIKPGVDTTTKNVVVQSTQLSRTDHSSTDPNSSEGSGALTNMIDSKLQSKTEKVTQQGVPAPAKNGRYVVILSVVLPSVVLCAFGIIFLIKFFRRKSSRSSRTEMAEIPLTPSSKHAYMKV